MHEQLIEKLNPDPDVLMIELSKLVDDSMLAEIANADYSAGFEESLAELYKIRDRAEGLVPMQYYPREVLHLTRWSEPDSFDMVDSRIRGHTIRAFACAALLRADAEPPNWDYCFSENDTLAQLLASLPYLERVDQNVALRFLAWRVQRLPLAIEHIEDAFFLLALLILALRTGASLSNAELAELIAWLFDAELDEHTAPDNRWATGDSQWLLGLTMFDQEHNVWVSLGTEIANIAAGQTDTGIRQSLLDIAARLTQYTGTQ